MNINDKFNKAYLKILKEGLEPHYSGKRTAGTGVEISIDFFWSPDEDINDYSVNNAVLDNGSKAFYINLSLDLDYMHEGESADCPETGEFTINGWSIDDVYVIIPDGEDKTTEIAYAESNLYDKESGADPIKDFITKFSFDAIELSDNDYGNMNSKIWRALDDYEEYY